MINLVYGSGAEIGDPALASPDLAGVHFTGSTGVFNGDVADGRREHRRSYRNYPRIVGETGGKDFIVAHPSADVDAVATAIVRGSFEYQGQKCSAASRVFVAVEPLAASCASGSSSEVRDAHDGRRRATSRNFMGAVIDGSSFKTQKRRDRRGERASGKASVVGGGYDDSEGWFVEPTVIETSDPDFRHDARGALRPGRDGVRLRRDEVRRHARPRRRGAPYGLTGAVFARDRARDRRGAGARSATRRATSTSTTSRPARSSASSRSAARARRARTTRRARCGT